MSDSREKSRRSHVGLEEDSRDLEMGMPKRRRTNSNGTNIWHSRFVEFFEFSPIPFLILSKGNISEVNVAACELFGSGIGKIKKRTFSALFANPEVIRELLKEVQSRSGTVESIVSLKSGARVRFHAMRFLQNGEKIRVGLTREVSDPKNGFRLNHVMLAAQDAICIYGPREQISANKAARVLLRDHQIQSLQDLLASLSIDESLSEIDSALEAANLWKRPISLDGLAYRLTISHIFYELCTNCEYLVQISPLENSEENTLLQQARSMDSVSDLALSPLTVIKSAASLLKVIDPKSDEYERVIDLLENNVEVLKSLFGGLNALAQNNLAFESVPIVSILSRAVEQVRKINAINIELEISDPSLLIWVEREIAVGVLFELLFKCSRNTEEVIGVEIEESSTHLSFNISYPLLDSESEMYLKKMRETLAQIGADVHQVPESDSENRALISLIFLRGKK